MQTNRVKKIIREGGLALGTYVGGIADPQIVEIIGHAGFDAAFIDMEHTSISFADVEHLTRAAQVAGMIPLVAPAWSQHMAHQLHPLLESGIRPGWVRGEVTNLRAQASGHVYFALKDAGAQLSAVMFRGDAARQTVKLRDGLQVLVYGEISVYEVRGNYQLIVRAVIEDGVGRLQREFEEHRTQAALDSMAALNDLLG